MSEFKFACPVCGQHITSDSSASGRQLECPTCFQKIVVPQAPASGQSKLILSAAQVKSPRPSDEQGADLAGWRQTPVKTSLASVGVLLFLLAAFLVGWRFWGEKAVERAYHAATRTTNAVAELRASPNPPHPVPKDIVWSRDVTNARMPQATAAGQIRGTGFLCERAVLNNGNLSLRQGRGWPPELGLTVFLNAQPGEDLSRRVVVIPPSQPPPVPQVGLRWRDERQQPVTERFYSNYSLKIIFGQATNGTLPGRIYAALPDDAHSVVAGDFEAELRNSTRRSP
jgi:hypothetical protein